MSTRHYYGHRTMYSGNSQVSMTNITAKVKPDMQSANKTATAWLVFSILLIPAGMICFMAPAFTGSFMDSGGFPPTIFIGMVCFMGGGVLSGVMGIKKAYISQIVNLMNEIKSHDKISIESLSLSTYVGKAQMIMLIKKLIETGNLSEYQVIGEVGVAKITVQARESDFVSTATYVNGPVTVTAHPKPSKCPSCGSPITKDDDKFCDHCGTRL